MARDPEVKSVGGRGPDGSRDRYAIRAVQRVCNLLDLLQAETEGISLARAAEVTELPKASAFRYLATLEGCRYVDRNPDSGLFRLGTALLPLEIRQLSRLTQRIRPHLEELRDEFQETANLGMFDGRGIVYLDIVESTHTMRLAARPNDRAPIHCTALGKAIAADLPEELVREILKEEGMPRRTPRTIVSMKAFLEALTIIRKKGFAVDIEENEIGALCVAWPLQIGGVRLSISVSGPSARLTQKRVPEVAKKLEQVANTLSTTNG